MTTLSTPTGSSTTTAQRANLSPELGTAERDHVFAAAMKYVRDEDAAADVADGASSWSMPTRTARSGCRRTPARASRALKKRWHRAKPWR